MALQSTTPLATVTLQATSNEVVFSGIPATYRDLILIVNCRHTGSGAQNLIMQFNSDAGNASRVYMAGYSSTTESGTLSNLIAQFNDQNNNEVGISHIMDYSATDKHKTVLTRTNDSIFVEAMAQRWASTAAINSIRLAYTSTFAIGSTFSLYGRIA
jgi:hypothetical protein